MRFSAESLGQPAPSFSASSAAKAMSAPITRAPSAPSASSRSVMRRCAAVTSRGVQIALSRFSINSRKVTTPGRRSFGNGCPSRREGAPRGRLSSAPVKVECLPRGCCCGSGRRCSAAAGVGGLDVVALIEGFERGLPVAGQYDGLVPRGSETSRTRTGRTPRARVRGSRAGARRRVHGDEDEPAPGVDPGLLEPQSASLLIRSPQSCGSTTSRTLPSRFQRQPW